MSLMQERSGAPFQTATGRTVDPYLALAGAFLARVISDAQGRNLVLGRASQSKAAIIEEAQAFLADRTAVAGWCEVVGADPDKLLPTLYAEAQKGRTDA